MLVVVAYRGGESESRVTGNFVFCSLLASVYCLNLFTRMGLYVFLYLKKVKELKKNLNNALTRTEKWAKDIIGCLQKK